MTWYHAVVFFHVLSAALWVGGILFLSVVAVPILRRLDPGTRARVVSELGRRFRGVGWTLLLLLWLTGVVQLVVRGGGWENVVTGAVFATRFGRLMALKLGMVVLMMIVSFVHDYIIGPRATQAAAAGADITPWRRQATALARIVGLLAIAIVLVAVLLPR
ncbi:MAG TPA: DUF4149 domain-containing protein [Bacillota bacterium]